LKGNNSSETVILDKKCLEIELSDSLAAHRRRCLRPRRICK